VDAPWKGRTATVRYTHFLGEHDEAIEAGTTIRAWIPVTAPGDPSRETGVHVGYAHA
jgi:hypothetical protein